MTITRKPYWDREKQRRCYRNPVPIDERRSGIMRDEVEAWHTVDDAGHDYGDLFDHLDTALRNLVRCALMLEDVAMEEDQLSITEYGAIPVHLMPGYAANSKGKRRRTFIRVPRHKITMPSLGFLRFTE